MAVRILFLIVLAVWAGIIIGVSLIATPVKFQAPSLTLETGLEIGRYTFRFLGRVELCLLVITLAAAAIAQTPKAVWIVLALIIVILAVQHFWLLPFLDKRVSEILAGAPPSFSIRHKIFAAMEAGKALLLIAAAATGYYSQLRG
jgi:hypothetical protein